MSENLKTAHRRRFPEAFEAMLEEMDRHQPEKGDSWETLRLGELVGMINYAVTGYSIGETHALDVANLAVMLHLRLKEE